MEHQSTRSTNLTTGEFIAKCSDMMIPLTGSMAYFSVVPLDEDETERLVYDPATAIPPRALKLIPRLRLVLVPYLESTAESDAAGTGLRIAFQAPDISSKRYVAFEQRNGANYLFIAVRDEGLFDAHIVFFETLADRLIAEGGDEFVAPFNRLVEAELRSRANGELNERAWRAKQAVRTHPGDRAGKRRLKEQYLRQALKDTLTLYMHGLCCDLDVEGGPKQLPAQFIRKRLLLLKDQLPPPKGVALFPEELPDY